MRVTLLGTGTPFPDGSRFGSATLIEAGEKRLLFDCGRGALIRLKQAEIPVTEVDSLFITHLHSDHTVGIPDLWLTGWFLGRKVPLQVWGPAGTREMMEHLAKAYGSDIRIRDQEPENLPPKGAEIHPQEVQQGIVYKKGPLRVTAFLVDHAHVKPAFGYRIEYSGRSVVISGDTKYSENLIEISRGTDCLIHAAWMVGANNPTPPALRSIASAEDAARVFAAVRPRLAVLYHYADVTGMEEAVQAQYEGDFLVGDDLMVLEIGDEITLRARRPQVER